MLKVERMISVLLPASLGEQIERIWDIFRKYEHCYSFVKELDALYRRESDLVDESEVAQAIEQVYTKLGNWNGMDYQAGEVLKCLSHKGDVDRFKDNYQDLNYPDSNTLTRCIQALKGQQPN